MPGGERSSFDGPGSYEYMCLDHVREFNARFNYFAGMSAEELLAAQDPFGGWERETRAFAATGADAAPRWADFKDPMDALGARYRHVRREAEARAAGVDSEVARAYRTLGAPITASRSEVRRAYVKLAAQYHPDRNGGDRRMEGKLREVVSAYQLLKASGR